MFISFLIGTPALGHYNMVYPPTWYDPSGDTILPYNSCHKGACMWFSNHTFIAERTMPANSEMRTYARTDPDFTRFGRNPWASPGRALVFSPCGHMGGNPFGCPFGDLMSAGKVCPFGGIGFGEDARVVYNEPKGIAGHYGEDARVVFKHSTTWQAGSVVEVAMGIRANHGGGYNYRLCKLGRNGVLGVTEECFQETPLDFYGDKQWAQEGFDISTRVEFEARRTRVGTWPKKSQWTRIPVPACLGVDADGGVRSDTSNECLETGGFQFPPPAPGISGYGNYLRNTPNFDQLERGEIGPDQAIIAPSFAFSIIDKVVIPEDLEPGKYVLSQRIDAEQTAQVWTTCADINIIA